MEGQDFYSVIKKWIIRDYSTQGIKAEVIIDMLISEIIEELVDWKMHGENIQSGKIRLVAKEFPLISKAMENHQNTKVDYLLYQQDGNITYLVELKTSRNSIEKEQMKRYLNIKEEEKLWKECLELFVSIVESDLCKKRWGEKIGGEELSSKRKNFRLVDLIGSEKYITTIYGMIKWWLTMNPSLKKDNIHDKVLEIMKEMLMPKEERKQSSKSFYDIVKVLENSKIQVVYIFLGENRKTNEKGERNERHNQEIIWITKEDLAALTASNQCPLEKRIYFKNVQLIIDSLYKKWSEIMKDNF